MILANGYLNMPFDVTEYHLWFYSPILSHSGLHIFTIIRNDLAITMLC